MEVVVLVVDVLVVVEVVEVELEVELEVDVLVVVCDVEVLVVIDMVVVVELDVEVVVPATEYQEEPSYLFHSFSVESKYISPSTGLEGCEVATFILPEKLLNFVMLFYIITLFSKTCKC